jgi:hypothetical protein
VCRRCVWVDEGRLRTSSQATLYGLLVEVWLVKQYSMDLFATTIGQHWTRSQETHVTNLQQFATAADPGRRVFQMVDV